MGPIFQRRALALARSFSRINMQGDPTMKLRQLSASPRGTLVQAAIADRRNCPARLAHRPEHLLRVPLPLSHPVDRDGPVALADHRGGGALHAALGPVRPVSFHLGGRAAAGHPGVHFARRHGPVRLRSDAKPAPGAGGGRGPAGSREAARIPHREQPRRHPDHQGGLHGGARQLGGPPAVRRGSGGAARAGISGATFRRWPACRSRANRTRPSAPRCNAAESARTATFFWPTSSFPLT